MADDKAKTALREARAAIVAVHEGRVDQPGQLVFEGVRTYSASKDEIRRATPHPTDRKRVVEG